MKKYAAVMGNTFKNDVIGYLIVTDNTIKNVEIAGCFTIDGTPVNVTTHKISYEKRKCEKASYTQPISLHKSGVYTFHFVDMSGNVGY